MKQCLLDNQVTSSIGIYRIIAPSGKCYVGMTMTNFKKRWRQHLKELRNGNHKCTGLKNAYNKYGEAQLIFEILEIIPENSTVVSALKKEQLWWDWYSRSGVKLYNGRPTGTGSVFHSSESRARLAHTQSEKHKQNKSDIVCTICFIVFQVSPSQKWRKRCKVCTKIVTIKKLKKYVCKKCKTSFETFDASRTYCSRRCVYQSQDTTKIIEKEALVLFQSGHSLRSIASILNCSHQTVKNALANINT